VVGEVVKELISEALVHQPVRIFIVGAEGNTGWDDGQ
jgi:hypothetical protein